MKKDFIITDADLLTSPWSRIVQPGINACDGFPKCRYEGKGRELRDHKRECAFSDAGAMYRVFRGQGVR